MTMPAYQHSSRRWMQRCRSVPSPCTGLRDCERCTVAALIACTFCSLLVGIWQNMYFSSWNGMEPANIAASRLRRDPSHVRMPATLAAAWSSQTMHDTEIALLVFRNGVQNCPALTTVPPELANTASCRVDTDRSALNLTRSLQRQLCEAPSTDRLAANSISTHGGFNRSGVAHRQVCRLDHRAAIRGSVPYLPMDVCFASSAVEGHSVDTSTTQHHTSSAASARESAMDGDSGGTRTMRHNRPLPEATEHLVVTAALRNGYQYEVVREGADRGRQSEMTVEHRVVCVDSRGWWSLLSGVGTATDVTAQDTVRQVNQTRVRELLARGGVDAMPGVEKGVSGKESSGNGRGRTELLSMMTAGLSGQLAVPPQAAGYRDVEKLPKAPLWVWLSLLMRGLRPMQAAKLHERLSYGTGSVGRVLAALAQRWEEYTEDHGRGAGSRQGVVNVWGLDDAGTMYGWRQRANEGARSCLRCLQYHEASIFVMYKPAWLWNQPISVVRSSDRPYVPPPDLLVSDSACRQSVEGIRLRQVVVNVGGQGRGGGGQGSARVVQDLVSQGSAIPMQCALPVWLPARPSHVADGTSGGGPRGTETDRILPVVGWDGGGAVVELVQRTGFFTAELWGGHFTHWLMNNIIPNMLIWEDMGGLPALDRPTGRMSGEGAFDSSFLSRPTAPSRRSGVGSSPLDIVEATCYQRTVFGMASICPIAYCDRQPTPDHLDGVRDSILTHYRHGPPQKPLHSQHVHRIVVLQRRSSRVLQNIEPVTALLQSFSGVEVEVAELTTPTVEEQTRLFMNVSLLVAPHGNALGNALWMPRGAAVLELLPEGLWTRFFIQLGAGRLHWRQLGCEEGELGKPLTEDGVRETLAPLEKVCPWFVAMGTLARLLSVQSDIEGGGYKAAEEVRRDGASDGINHVNRTPNNRGSCLLDSGRVHGGVPALSRFIFIPLTALLRHVVDLLLRVCQGSRIEAFE